MCRLIEMIDEVLDIVSFDADKQVKTFKSGDGREVVIIHPTPFTITRIYVTGRPDGKRPHGRDSYFDYFKEQYLDYVDRHGSDEGFALCPEDWQKMFSEATLRYLRYLTFAGIRRWRGVDRDTATNIELCDFARKYAPPEIAWQIYEFKGYILMMNAIARAEQRLRKIDYNGAIEELDAGIAKIGKFCGECLKEGRGETEAITREKYLDNIIQFRNDIAAVKEKIESQDSLDEVDWEELSDLLEMDEYEEE